MTSRTDSVLPMRAGRLLVRLSADDTEIPSEDERAALRRLVQTALGDTGQSRKVANFLLAWWNAVECGGFDLTDLWGLDYALADDVLLVAGMIARLHSYPDALGFEGAFRQIVATWRPDNAAGAGGE